MADSLFALAKSGKDFAELARTNSQDPGSAINGGDLGWFNEGMMVKPFNDACFEGNKGDLVKVESQFGWHIINIQDKGKPVSKYELATYVKNVVYSQKRTTIFTHKPISLHRRTIPSRNLKKPSKKRTFPPIWP
jgi:peptidyl-prolyl cis-trans isomerase D